MKQFRPEILRFASMFILAAIAPLLGAEQAPRGESWRARAEQFVMVGGEVKIPNRVLFTNGMTALDTIRIAKGVTDKASKTRVEVRRREARSEERRVGKECRSRWSPY